HAVPRSLRCIRLIDMDLGIDDRHWESSSMPREFGYNSRFMSRGARLDYVQGLAEQIAHRRDDRIRRLARQEMAGDRDHTPLVARGEVLRVALRLSRRPTAVAVAMQYDCRRGDLRPFGQPLLQRLQRRISRPIAVAVTVRLDRHRDKVGIVEAR